MSKRIFPDISQVMSVATVAAGTRLLLEVLTSEEVALYKANARKKHAQQWPMKVRRMVEERKKTKWPRGKDGRFVLARTEVNVTPR